MHKTSNAIAAQPIGHSKRCAAQTSTVHARVVARRRPGHSTSARAGRHCPHPSSGTSRYNNLDAFIYLRYSVALGLLFALFPSIVKSQALPVASRLIAHSNADSRSSPSCGISLYYSLNSNIHDIILIAASMLSCFLAWRWFSSVVSKHLPVRHRHAAYNTSLKREVYFPKFVYGCDAPPCCVASTSRDRYAK